MKALPRRQKQEDKPRFNYGCEIICNENDIFPAMKTLIEDEGLSIKAVARFVKEDSGGQVTEERAKGVYRRRKTKPVWSNLELEAERRFQWQQKLKK